MTPIHCDIRRCIGRVVVDHWTVNEVPHFCSYCNGETPNTAAEISDLILHNIATVRYLITPPIPRFR